MSASALADPRKLDLQVRDGDWYRTVEAYADNGAELEPIFSNHGAFIACHELLNGRPLEDNEIYVRAKFIIIIRWAPIEPA